ncbi:alpha-L-rhamnosidase C-terminal domain-containing protein [Kiritimatiellota bacterium B12222]|nr:alpha-L-rhamnosidase C-terminal domain-containing protein [Kiritimatiellota bacterium B12222]
MNPSQKTVDNCVKVSELRQSYCAPERVDAVAGGYMVTFPQAGFGRLEVVLTSRQGGEEVEVEFAEKLDASGEVDRSPAGCIRYRKSMLTLNAGTHRYKVKIRPDKRNTLPQAIHMPPEIGEVLPFRYVRLNGCPQAPGVDDLRQVMVHVPWDEGASSFSSSSTVLNQVWSLCKHSIKATSFAGIYVDGDRERIPYEGDAYINQLCHYAVDAAPAIARRSLRYLLQHPTWPTEWVLHFNFMAWADYMQSGDLVFLAEHYETLKDRSLYFMDRGDGLVETDEPTLDQFTRVGLSQPFKDLVDWPPASFTEGGYGEDDGYDKTCKCNTVVNAFCFQNYKLLFKMATVLGLEEEAATWRARVEKVRETFQLVFFDEERGLYRDGEGGSHCAQHANFFPLCFGLVPAEAQATVTAFVIEKGMSCSVYGAQYLLESLYKMRKADDALALMEAKHDRSWWNMIQVGSTITLEAWDWKYKNNLDWNHAWGAAPLNIIPRYLFGIRPVEAGWGKIIHDPQPGGLDWARLVLPTPRGEIRAEFSRDEKGNVIHRIDLPDGVELVRSAN